MALALSLLKLAAAIPFLVGMLLGIAAILNLLFDPAESSEPEFLQRQSVGTNSALLLAALLLLLAVQYWGPTLIPIDDSLPAAHPLRLLQLASAYVLACLFFGWRTRCWPRALPLSFCRRPVMAYAVFLPFLAGVAMLNRILVEDVFGGQLPTQVLTGIQSLDGWDFSIAVLMIVVFLPWLEEILFRKYLWGTLVKNPGFGIFRAVLFTSLAFTVFHPPSVWLPVFCLGLLLTWVRWRSGRLKEAVIIHQLHNLIVLLLFYPGNS